jgi:L-threonylcarbamoyladenylate synthase
VQDEFGPDLLILDGGACQVGIESSIVDCTRGAPVLLRPGAITPAQIEAACGLAVLQPQSAALAGQAAPRASGTLRSHYAPRAKVRLLSAKEMQAALPNWLALSSASVLALYSRTAWLPADFSARVQKRTMPPDATAAAQQLFAVLRELDAHPVHEIWVETPPDDAAWDGVRDRLQRAAATPSPSQPNLSLGV